MIGQKNGHFDHVGAIEDLLEHWNVPVYTHSVELPFLTGLAEYALPDPGAGGGLMAWISPLFPATHRPGRTRGGVTPR